MTRTLAGRVETIHVCDFHYAHAAENGYAKQAEDPPVKVSLASLSRVADPQAIDEWQQDANARERFYQRTGIRRY